MNYRGTVIEEILEKVHVLKKEVRILETKTEPVTIGHRTPWLTRWTLLTVEIPEEKADQVAEKLSNILEKEHPWYADYKNDQYHYITYRDKVFKIDLKKPTLYKDATRYGISLGIPDYQVDFAPEDKIWER